MAHTFRPRARQVIAPVAAAVLLAAATALLQLPEPPSWLAWGPAWLMAAIGAALGAGGATTVDRWRARREAEVDRDRPAITLLVEHLGRQAGLVRIGEQGAHPLALRVHEAIPLVPTGELTAAQLAPGRHGTPLVSRAERSAVGGLDPDLPAFVDRTHLQVGEQVKEWMRAARDSGGFLVVVGNSSVGKTRLLYETARQVLPDHVVLAPDLGDGGLVHTVASARFPLPKLILWLDELQRFLPGPYFVPNQPPGQDPVAAGDIRKLLAAGVMILATLWPEHLTQLRATGKDPQTGEDRPRYSAAVDILSSRVTTIRLETFSEDERAAAAHLASLDPRLARAVADRDYNVTEVLAGARHIMRRYQQATDAKKAVVLAAVDARRLGIQAPLTEALLCGAARGYLTTVHPDDTWFQSALAELTSTARRDDRATAPLPEIPDADHKSVTGYTVADYLLQHLTRERRRHRLSAVTWQALIDHTHDPADIRRLAISADRRLLYRQAEALYRTAAD
ncbi:MAG: Tetratricopeptide repeat protein, partial [Pseudonocardia sp.]|nr:Tetratricopeptide repeat protein [Pseudonocardia sp.]